MQGYVFYFIVKGVREFMNGNYKDLVHNLANLCN